MDDDFCRELTKDSLINECEKIINNYMQIYDEYYATGSRDSAFLKDLVDAIKGISACLEVYARDGEIHPRYAVEKLSYTESLVKCVKKYFEDKKDGE